MKKVLALVAAAMLTTAAFAEKVVEVGLKGGLLLNAGTKAYIGDTKVDGTKMSVGGDIGIFGHFGLAEIGSGALSLQPELFFSIANGLKQDFGFFDATLKQNTLDIAVLLGYDIPLGKARLTPFLGPKLGFAIGKGKMVVDGVKGENPEKTKGVGFGLDFGVGFAVPLGHFVLGADVRYGIDFTKFKVDGDDDGRKIRRGALGINLTAGYRF